jgi:hypothetical protein
VLSLEGYDKASLELFDMLDVMEPFNDGSACLIEPRVPVMGRVATTSFSIDITGKMGKMGGLVNTRA